MKPMIVYVKENENNTVTIAKAEFERAVERAYETGYNDANPLRVYNGGITCNTPSIPLNVVPCDSVNISGDAVSHGCIGGTAVASGRITVTG